MKNIFEKIIVGIVCAVVIVGLAGLIAEHSKNANASVVTGEGYDATTTPGLAATQIIRGGPGMLGSVIVTGSNTGTFNLYDATTSDATKRAASMSTSTILVASFPTLTSTSTYTYDVTLKYGLLYVGVGSVSTSTITSK